jgi:hypothetical protein
MMSHGLERVLVTIWQYQYVSLAVSTPCFSRKSNNLRVTITCMRVFFVALVLTITMMSGCLGGDEDVDTKPTTPASKPSTPITAAPTSPTTPAQQYRLMTQFDFADCHGIRFTAPLSTLQAADLIHSNYTATSRGETQALPAPEAQPSQLDADLFRCSSFTAGQYFFENVWFGMVSIPVEAPADAKEADTHAYIVQMVGGEDVLSSIWKVVRYPSYKGNTSLAEAEATLRAMAGEYQWDVAQSIPATGSNDATFTWYRELPNGDRLTWTGEHSIPAGTTGAASLAFPETAPFAGTVVAAGQTISGQGSVHTQASWSGMDLIQEVAAFRE